MVLSNNVSSAALVSAIVLAVAPAGAQQGAANGQWRYDGRFRIPLTYS